MKIRSFSPGDLVAKISWENRPLWFGIITEVRPAAGRAWILSSNGHNWEYIHDIVPHDDLPRRNK